MRKCCLFLLMPFFLLSGCMSQQVKELGVIDGKLKYCPGTPNCVSTQTDEPYSKMEPLVYTEDLDTIRNRVIEIINASERAKIIKVESNYIHAEFKTKIMRLIDDVEFYFDDEKKVLHYRSASRFGYADLGVNRERMNDIIKKIKEGKS